MGCTIARLPYKLASQLVSTQHALPRAHQPLPVECCRVDDGAILGSDAAALAAAVTALVRVEETAAAEGGDPPVLDPVADLKLNSLGEWAGGGGGGVQHVLAAVQCSCMCVCSWALVGLVAAWREEEMPTRPALPCLPADLVGDFRLRAQLAAQRAAMPCHRWVAGCQPSLPRALATDARGMLAPAPAATCLCHLFPSPQHTLACLLASPSVWHLHR